MITFARTRPTFSREMTCQCRFTKSLSNSIMINLPQRQWCRGIPSTCYYVWVFHTCLYPSFYVSLSSNAVGFCLTVLSKKKKRNTVKTGLNPTMKYTISKNTTGRIRSKGRPLMFRATKYALSLYISADLSFINIAHSRGKVKIAVNTGKKPQNTEVKNSSPACTSSILSKVRLNQAVQIASTSNACMSTIKSLTWPYNCFGEALESHHSSPVINAVDRTCVTRTQLK